MRVVHTSSRFLIERAELEELVAERAADVARYADSLGQRGHADVFWRVVRQCRVMALMLSVQGATAGPP
jgi:hypothetical protein